MKIEYRKADITDAELLIDIYNFAFYSDYIKYGECPAYGKTKEIDDGRGVVNCFLSNSIISQAVKTI